MSLKNSMPRLGRRWPCANDPTSVGTGERGHLNRRLIPIETEGAYQLSSTRARATVQRLIFRSTGKQAIQKSKRRIMKLTSLELAYVRAQGLHVTEKCDGCGKLLNQTVQYTITGRREVYCSAACRDTAFFSDLQEVNKRATPGKCAQCGGSLKGKKRGSIFCDDACRKAQSRKIQRITTPKVEKSRTPTQLNQGVGNPKTADQGNCIANGSEALRQPVALRQ
jgi:hypothetical protein